MPSPPREGLEVRYITAQSARLQMEIRAGEKRPRVVGMPIVFDVWSLDLGGFQERIRREAVEFSFAERTDRHLFIDHDASKVMGRTLSGTLRDEITDAGVRIENDPPDRTDAADVLESIRRGDIDGMSFAFRVPPDGDEWEYAETGPWFRTIRKMVVSEYSIVARPAYPQTDVALRRLEDARGARRRLGLAEARLRLNLNR